MFLPYGIKISPLIFMRYFYITTTLEWYPSNSISHLLNNFQHSLSDFGVNFSCTETHLIIILAITMFNDVCNELKHYFQTFLANACGYFTFLCSNIQFQAFLNKESPKICNYENIYLLFLFFYVNS